MKTASTARSRALNAPMGGRGSCTRRKYASAQRVTASEPTSPTTIWNSVAPGISALLRLPTALEGEVEWAGEGGLQQVGAHAAQRARSQVSGDAHDRDVATLLGDQPVQRARRLEREFDVRVKRAGREAGRPALAGQRFAGL